MKPEFNKADFFEWKEKLNPEMINMMKRNYSACFSGHRPQKLGKFAADNTQDLRAAIEREIAAGYWYFICGGSIGFDSIAAEMIIELKRTNDELLLEIAVPCRTQADRWNKADRARYQSILEFADVVTYVSEGEYTDEVMQKRNEYMVKNCSLLICCFKGHSGGTKNTIKFAEKTGVDIVNIWR